MAVQDKFDVLLKEKPRHKGGDKSKFSLFLSLKFLHKTKVQFMLSPNTREGSPAIT
jgi:hypothetical protein